MIVFENVTKIYPGRGQNPITALDNISLKIGEKEFVSLVGKSGAGKTTLLRLLLREDDPTTGKIFFGGEDVSSLKKAYLPLLRRRIGTVFQDYKLFPSKTIYENVAYILQIIGVDDKEIERDVSHVLEIVGLTDRANNFPTELSGGERQRVAIARALIHRPEVILADEPTGNLDPYNTSEIMKLLLKIYEAGTTVVLATHNKSVINQLKKRVVTLENGKIIRDEEKGRFVI